MLVLSRKKDEVIVINKDISVRVLAIKGNVVRLGVIAPKTVSVHRGEVQDSIDQKETPCKP